jgi:hypothetical protein
VFAVCAATGASPQIARRTRPTSVNCRKSFISPHSRQVVFWSGQLWQYLASPQHDACPRHMLSFLTKPFCPAEQTHVDTRRNSCRHLDCRGNHSQGSHLKLMGTSYTTLPAVSTSDSLHLYFETSVAIDVTYPVMYTQNKFLRRVVKPLLPACEPAARQIVLLFRRVTLK